MNDLRSPVDTLARHGVVPVVTIDRVDTAVPLGRALIEGGLPCAEITFRTGAAPGAIEALTQSLPEMLVGAGTVLTVAQAEEAVSAGARFLVSPVLDDAVIDWCLTNEIPVVPGALTPTEVARAVAHGLSMVKFFPAASGGGPAALEAMAAVFPGIRFIPTGGIGLDDLPTYLRLPMVAACGGSWTTPRRLIDEGDVRGIAQLTATTVATVRSVRSEP